MGIFNYLLTQLKKFAEFLLCGLTSPVGHVVTLLFGLGLACLGALELSGSSAITPQDCPVCPDQVSQQLQDAISGCATSSAVTTSNHSLTVDVAGAVKKPGIYSLPHSARIADAVNKAGGFTETADAFYIAQKLNLASKLSPDSKLYIPSAGETVSPTYGAKVSEDTLVASTDEEQKSLININTASKTKLMELVSVGEVTANKIIANRPYSTTAELIEKNVVSETLFHKITQYITAE